MTRRRIRAGTALDRNVTVLGTVENRTNNAVYIVWHHRAWCPMACKLLGSYAAARREAAVLHRFDHPNIVRCFGAGRAGYVLMEYLEGPRLSTYIYYQPGGRLSVSDAMRATMYLGAALMHMHSRGYLHLDVKPSNAIVYRGRPILFDFDIAQRQSKRRRKAIVGTPSYMAPEQCNGELLTSATDVFGLGVTLYKALTGVYPFPTGRGGNPHPQTKVDATPLRRHLSSAPPRLEELLQRSLSKRPADRPALLQLLPALHELIVEGPPMWPEGFDPSQRVAPTRPARRAKTGNA